ncbi:MAG TPA: hypothetical protein DHV14_13100 [Micrococcales bacterium]|uniref:DUF4097 domain-containing protein n=1 Tax=Miniimonas arenae TaxID=676201 RepID=A0A5C5BCZ3_9MICO|nr:DUF4097 family beta strand repeat-containing protein [Miniimonas arenae]TNU75958.1 DUF4097 domain-containing protein [Miniimonas arenae]HCX86043.1 hypothetical protein [Micrococcales bacterium]
MPTQSWIVPAALTTEIGPVPQVRVQLVGGAVRVTGRAEPGVHLAVSDVVGSPVEVTADDAELTVVTTSAGWEGWLKRLGSHRSADAAQVTLAVGPGARVRIGTVGASVEVSDVVADVQLASASGALTAARTTGSLTVRSVSGALTVTEQDGPLRAQTVSGVCDLAGDVGRVDVASVSGRVHLVTTRASSAVRVQTVSGDVAVAVPPGSGVVLTARTVSGAVSLDGVDRRTSTLPLSVVVDERGDGDAAFVEIVTVTGAVAVTRGDGMPDEGAADGATEGATEHGSREASHGNGPDATSGAVTPDEPGPASA